MAEKQPTALVIDRDARSRQRVVALLRESGFAVVNCAQGHGELAALTGREFDLAVIAGELHDGSDARALARHVRNCRPDVKLLILATPGATPTARDDNLRVVARPLDSRELGAAVRELMAHEGDSKTGRDAAEFALIEAQLACLFSRHAAAERSGARTVARDIAHQIGDTMAARQGLLQSRSGV